METLSVHIVNILCILALSRSFSFSLRRNRADFRCRFFALAEPTNPPLSQSSVGAWGVSFFFCRMVTMTLRFPPLRFLSIKRSDEPRGSVTCASAMASLRRRSNNNSTEYWYLRPCFRQVHADRRSTRYFRRWWVHCKRVVDSSHFCTELRRVPLAFSTIVVLFLVMLLPSTCLRRAVMFSRSAFPVGVIERPLSSVSAASPENGGKMIDVAFFISSWTKPVSPNAQVDHLQLWFKTKQLRWERKPLLKSPYLLPG